MFFKPIEEFHLRLGKLIPGSTISIGGEEKSQKITNTVKGDFEGKGLGDAYKVQATEDASKWNECLSPFLFQLFHQTIVNDDNYKRMGLSPVNDQERLFTRIATFLFMIISIKRIHLGPGIQLWSKLGNTRRDWFGLDPNCLNVQPCRTDSYAICYCHIIHD